MTGGKAVKADLEFALVHDGRQWVARGRDAAGTPVMARGESLPALDDDLAAALAVNQGCKGQTLTIFMGFDTRTLPAWLRQYSPHYFNRFVTLTP